MTDEPTSSLLNQWMSKMEHQGVGAGPKYRLLAHRYHEGLCSETQLGNGAPWFRPLSGLRIVSSMVVFHPGMLGFTRENRSSASEGLS